MIWTGLVGRWLVFLVLSLSFAIGCMVVYGGTLPRGWQIAYVTVTDSRRDIYLYQFGYDVVVPLTLDDRVSDHTPPVWSPDGERLAFVNTSNGFTLSVATVDRYVESFPLESYPGSFPVKAQVFGPMSWSPDGCCMAVSTNALTHDGVRLVNTDDSSVQTLPSPSSFLSAWVTWSPDGRWIAYRLFSDQNDLLGFDIEDSTFRSLMPGDVPDSVELAPIRYPARWSPDGRLLLAQMVSRENGDGRFLLIDMTTETSRILPTDASAWIGRWSPDGSKILYLIIDDVGETFVGLMDITSGEERILSDGHSPRWSPDGDHFLWATTVPGRPSRWRIAPVDDPLDAHLLNIPMMLEPVWRPG